jgi:hypothetical protein
MEANALRTPDAVDAPAVQVDLGLRTPERTLRERVAPGIGHVWFARQLSWSCAALSLHTRINNRAVSVPAPSLIATALEALVTKAALFCREATPRHLGQTQLDPRRQEAHRGDWSFTTLCAPERYVQGAHRIAASSTLREDGGLGFARGTRYDTLALQPSGRALGDAFLDQAMSATDSVGVVLGRWILGDDILACAPMTLHAKLGAYGITDDERDVIGQVLVMGDDVMGNNGAMQRRRALAAVLGPESQCPAVESVIVPALHNAGHVGHADDILAARGFSALQEASSNVVRAIGDAMAQDGSVSFTRALQQWNVREGLDEARAASNVFRMTANRAGFEETSALYFAESVSRAGSAEAALRRILQRVPQTMTMGKSKVTQGAQFHALAAPEGDGYDAVEPDTSACGLANYHALLRDLNPV